MRNLVVLGSLLVCGGLWANDFCDGLNFKSTNIEVKQVYAEQVTAYCNSVLMDATGRCHLFSFNNDGTVDVKSQFAESVTHYCDSIARNEHSVTSEKEENWFVTALINYGSMPYRR